MSKENIKVEWVWVDENDKQVGVRVSLESGMTQDIALHDLSSLQGRLTNATVTIYGVQGKESIVLTHKNITRNTEHSVKTYTLMHSDEVVCRVFTELNKVEVINEDKLPFALRGIILTVPIFIEWLNIRIDNLGRMYMNKVYVQRKVGRDREKILRDSCGIAPIDNFWIYRSDINTSWGELKERRDINTSLVNTALTGELTESSFAETEKDTTTLFTVKGAFPKALYKGYMLKKDNNAEYEVAAYKIGKVLGISVAEATNKEEPGVVGCKLFTSEEVSMVHARDILHLTDCVSGADDEHRAVYDYFVKQGRNDIVKQLERLYIFNYLVENMDFHYENFGFLYNSSTFEFTTVAPGYDFNSAFDGYNDVNAYYSWILQNLPKFMNNNNDLQEKLNSDKFINTLNNISELSSNKKHSLKQRAEYLCTLTSRII